MIISCGLFRERIKSADHVATTLLDFVPTAKNTVDGFIDQFKVIDNSTY